MIEENGVKPDSQKIVAIKDFQGRETWKIYAKFFSLVSLPPVYFKIFEARQPFIESVKEGNNL